MVLERLPMTVMEWFRVARGTRHERRSLVPLVLLVPLMLAYLIRYDHLPETTFERTDKIVTAGVQVTY